MELNYPDSLLCHVLEQQLSETVSELQNKYVQLIVSVSVRCFNYLAQLRLN